MIHLLTGLGYQVTRRDGSHRVLECTERPKIVFAYHDRASLAPGVVRDILVKQVGLSQDEALEVARRG